MKNKKACNLPSSRLISAFTNWQASTQSWHISKLFGNRKNSIEASLDGLLVHPGTIQEVIVLYFE